MLYDSIKKSIRSLFEFLTNRNTYSRLISFVRSLFARTSEYKDSLEQTIPNWNIRERAHPVVFRYGVAILSVLLVGLIKMGVNDVIVYTLPFVLFYIAIVFSSWYGGLRPGILAVFLSAVLAGYLYLPFAPVHEFYSTIIVAILFISEGLVIVWLGHDMHRALQRLDEKKRQYQYFASIAQHISDAVISTDTKFNIQSWNVGAEALYGWKRGEVIGRPFNEVLMAVNLPETSRDLTSLLLHERFWKGEVMHRRRNGGRVYVLTSMSIMGDDNDRFQGIVAVNRDITDRKKLEQGKDDFIGLASHELKTPLTSIKLYVDILHQRLGDSHDSKSLTYLTKIDAQMKKLLELVNHLLDVSKVQSGKLQYNFEDTRIDTFVRQVVRDVQVVIPTHKIVVTNSDEAEAKIDKDRLRQVIVNILNNAVKYSANADRIEVSIDKERGHVVVGIRDFGIGIPKEKLNKIFERFYQVTDSKGYTYSGMGLGLFIAREIIEKHHGKLWVESEEGHGSVFYFSLPTGK